MAAVGAEDGGGGQHAEDGDAAPDSPTAAALGAHGYPKEASLWSSLPYMLAWTSSSILMLLYNKHLYKTGMFPFPLTLVMVHQVALGTALWALRAVAPTGVLLRLMPGAGQAASRMQFARACLPIAFLQAIAMASQNHALRLSNAHFVVMVNAAKPVLVWLLQVAFGLATLNCTHLKIVTVISSGVLIAVAGEADVVFAGVAALMTAQASEGVRVVLMQRSLSGKNELDAATLLSYSAPVCSLLLAPAAFLLEIQSMDRSIFAELGTAVLGASVVLAMLVNLTGALVIQRTDALVLTLTGVIKDFVGIFVSAWCFAARITPSQVLGYSIAVAFMHVYREFKQRETTLAAEGLCSVLTEIVCLRQVGRLQGDEHRPWAGGTCKRHCCCWGRRACILVPLVCAAVGMVALAQPSSEYARPLLLEVLTGKPELRAAGTADGIIRQPGH